MKAGEGHALPPVHSHIRSWALAVPDSSALGLVIRALPEEAGGWLSASSAAPPWRPSEELVTSSTQVGSLDPCSERLTDVFSSSFSVLPLRPLCWLWAGFPESLKQFSSHSRPQSLLTSPSSYLGTCCQLLSVHDQLRQISCKPTYCQTLPTNYVLVKGLPFLLKLHLHCRTRKHTENGGLGRK